MTDTDASERKYKIELFQPIYPHQDTPEFRAGNPEHSWYKLTGAWATNADYSNRTLSEADADLLTRDEALSICRNHSLKTKCHPPITVVY